HDAGVPGEAGAHLLVGGVRGWAPGVSHGGGVAAVRLPEGLLGAPEAAHAEHASLESLRERRFEPGAEDEVARRHRHALGAARQGLGSGRNPQLAREQGHGSDLRSSSPNMAPIPVARPRQMRSTRNANTAVKRLPGSTRRRSGPPRTRAFAGAVMGSKQMKDARAGVNTCATV